MLTVFAAELSTACSAAAVSAVGPTAAPPLTDDTNVGPAGVANRLRADAAAGAADSTTSRAPTSNEKGAMRRLRPSESSFAKKSGSTIHRAWQRGSAMHIRTALTEETSAARLQGTRQLVVRRPRGAEAGAADSVRSRRQASGQRHVRWRRSNKHLSSAAGAEKGTKPETS